jgi:hypothetical protein
MLIKSLGSWVGRQKKPIDFTSLKKCRNQHIDIYMHLNIIELFFIKAKIHEINIYGQIPLKHHKT